MASASSRGRLPWPVARLPAVFESFLVFTLSLAVVGCGGNSSQPGRDRFDVRALKNVSKIIDEILEGYDVRLRPQFGGRDQSLKLGWSVFMVKSCYII